MITRVIHTDIFKDKNFRKLNADTKMFYLTLILNDEIGQSRIYKCSDEFLAIYSGLTLTQVDKCKDDLEVAQMAIFKDDYVCISCDVGYVDSYYSGSKNDGAKIKEIERIPDDVLEYFLTILDTLSIGYRYYIDSLINNKSKSKYKSTQQNDSVDKPVDNYRYDDGKAKEFFESVKRK